MRDRRPSGHRHDRRTILKLGAGLAASGGILLLGATPLRAAAGVRTLSFRHLHTGETLKTTYWAEGRPISGALTEMTRLRSGIQVGASALISASVISGRNRADIACS